MQHGISTNLAVKVYKTYGDASLETVQKNPYQLERDIYGVGFKTTDRIVQALGLPVNHPSRIEARIGVVLNEMTNEGHVYHLRELLTQKNRGAAGDAAGVDPTCTRTTGRG
jgi:exodeoxyribonuclease V alpha subunit